MSIKFHRRAGLDVGDPAPASKVRVKSSSWEGVELTVSVYVCVFVCVVMFQSASFCDCCVCVWTLN